MQGIIISRNINSSRRLSKLCVSKEGHCFIYVSIYQVMMTLDPPQSTAVMSAGRARGEGGKDNLPASSMTGNGRGILEKQPCMRMHVKRRSRSSARRHPLQWSGMCTLMTSFIFTDSLIEQFLGRVLLKSLAPCMHRREGGREEGSVEANRGRRKKDFVICLLDILCAEGEYHEKQWILCVSTCQEQLLDTAGGSSCNIVLGICVYTYNDDISPRIIL